MLLVENVETSDKIEDESDVVLEVTNISGLRVINEMEEEKDVLKRDDFGLEEIQIHRHHLSNRPGYF